VVKKKGSLVQRNFPVPQNKHAVPLLEKELTEKIIGAAIEVHTAWTWVA
jgi:hypothetical protein